MNAKMTDTRGDAEDEEAIRAIHREMVEAWNAGDAAAFISSFADDADFVAFEGTHLKGREEMISFHREIFATVVRGSRIAGDVTFVRFVNAREAVMHSRISYAPDAGSAELDSRASMQLTVVSKREGKWRIEALMNARHVPMDRQLFLDAVDALPSQAKAKLNDHVSLLATEARRSMPST